MKQIKINAYEYKELSEDSKYEVKLWLDQIPFDYEDEDKQGNIVKKLDYPSDWSDEDIQEHCFMNGYLFNKYGKCVHHLQNK
mgnify:CR=1 FL=1